MKYLFALVLEFWLQFPDSQIVLLIINLFSLISGFLAFRSAAVNLVEEHKTNRERKRIRKEIIDNKIPVRQYIHFVTIRKKTMQLICTEYDLNGIFSAVIFCLTCFSFFIKDMILIAWIIFVVKILLCDLVGYLIMIIFGGMGKSGGTYWDFK